MTLKFNDDKPVSVSVEMPKPHSKKQELIMNAFCIHGVKKIYVSCGTKFGKSISAGVCLSNAVMQKDLALWRWIAPIYAQSKVGLKYMEKLLPPSPHAKTQLGNMRIELPYLNSEIEFWHTKNPESLEGVGSAGNIIDEASKCPHEAIISARTTVTKTKGREGYFSTPKGKNWFYKECMEAKEMMKWALKKGKTPEKIFIQAPTSDNPFIDKAVIEDARRTLPNRLFRQYYLAEFLDDGSVFIGFKACLRGEEIEAYDAVQTWLHDDAEEMEVFLGADWARNNDYTVITAFTINTGIPKMVGFLRFNGVGYVDILKELYKFQHKFKKVIMLYHDKTGVGIAVDDMLGQMDINFEGIVFTNSSKSLMVNNLMMGFETQNIQLPFWQEMIKEFDSFTVTTNALGTARYEAESGGHDDIVCSIMLAYHVASEYSAGFNLNILEDLPNKKQTVQDWYSDLQDDDF